MKSLIVRVFLIIGTLLVSLILWIFLIGTDVTTSSYASKGAGFEEVWYAGRWGIAWGATDTIDNSSQYADQHAITLRRFLQDYWVANSGLNGLESQFISEYGWHTMKNDMGVTTNMDSTPAVSSTQAGYWENPAGITIIKSTVSPIEIPEGERTVPIYGGGHGGGGGTDPTDPDPHGGDNPGVKTTTFTETLNGDAMLGNGRKHTFTRDESGNSAAYDAYLLTIQTKFDTGSAASNQFKYFGFSAGKDDNINYKWYIKPEKNNASNTWVRLSDDAAGAYYGYIKQYGAVSFLDRGFAVLKYPITINGELKYLDGVATTQEPPELYLMYADLSTRASNVDCSVIGKEISGKLVLYFTYTATDGNIFEYKISDIESAYEWLSILDAYRKTTNPVLSSKVVSNKLMWYATLELADGNKIEYDWSNEAARDKYYEDTAILALAAENPGWNLVGKLVNGKLAWYHRLDLGSGVYKDYSYSKSEEQDAYFEAVALIAAGYVPSLENKNVVFYYPNVTTSDGHTVSKYFRYSEDDNTEYNDFLGYSSMPDMYYSTYDTTKNKIVWHKLLKKPDGSILHLFDIDDDETYEMVLGIISMYGYSVLKEAGGILVAEHNGITYRLPAEYDAFIEAMSS